MKRPYSPNVIVVLRLLRGLGGNTLEVIAGGRHMKMRAVTPKGNPMLVVVSKHKADPYKMKGWLRQEINRADAKAEVVRLQNDRRLAAR